MLDKNALSQLNQLKQDIVESKDVATGLVRGTNGKFGFAVLEDGREAFITPDDMNRVFPGDKVRINVIEGKGGKPQAELEKLINSPLQRFVGQYHVRGQGHFVQPDLAQFNRWLFIPPSQRKNLKPGDYLYCQISQHPYHKEGKAQVKVVENLGDVATNGIEALYVSRKFEIDQNHNDACVKQAKELESQNLSSDSRFIDQSGLEFFTIDSAETLDMDDALTISSVDAGWQLQVAIACPAAKLEIDSPIIQAALAKAQTVYLPGNSQHMLPTSLSQHQFSLIAGELRQGLICRIDINKEGQITDYGFSTALISSKHKLNYQQVSHFLQGQEDAAITGNLAEQLHQLKDLSKARQAYRQQHQLVMEDRPDFGIELNDAGKIAVIHKYEKSQAHQMIEEAMLACNICAAQFLQENKTAGLYTTHRGFKEDKLKVIAEVIQQDFEDASGLDLASLADYRTFIKQLQNQEADFLPACKRMLQSSILTSKPEPHLGLGIEAYATITSPIRRYQDYYNQLSILSVLHGGDIKTADEQQLSELQDRLSAGRQAVRQMEQWLHCQFMQDKIGQTFSAHIGLVNGQGVGVRFDDSGIEGFALLQTKQQACELDHRRLQLKCADKHYKLDQSLQVTIKSIDLAQRRIAVEIVE